MSANPFEDDPFFCPEDKVLQTHGRSAFSLEFMKQVLAENPATSFSLSSTSSLTPEERQIERYGFDASKRRLYEYLIQHNIFVEVIHGAPIRSHCQEAAHMVPPSAEDDFLLLLEYAFGFLPRTLAVHSRWNLAPVDRHWHAVFDADGSFLLPSMNDLQYMADKINDIRVHRLSTKTFPEELHWKEIRHCGHNMIHEYAFIPFGFIYHTFPLESPPKPIVRYQCNTRSFAMYPYPYTTMEELSSHISPFFVLANCYRKFCIWRTPVNANKLPPPVESDLPHQSKPPPAYREHFNRVQHVLSSLERIKRNSYHKFRIWRTPVNANKLPPPVESDLPHQSKPPPAYREHFNRVQPVLSSPERIERYQMMFEIFQVLDSMNSEKLGSSDWTPRPPEDIYRAYEEEE